MEQRELEVTIISAKELNNVKHIGKMDVYINVSILGDKSMTVRSPVVVNGGSDPTFNCQTKFTIDEAAAQQNRSAILFKVKCMRTKGDKDIGKVTVPIKELLQSPHAVDGMKHFVSYQVMKPNGKPKGFLNFAYQFGEKVTKDLYPTYPQPHGVGSSSTYPQSSLMSPHPPEGSYHPPPRSEGNPMPPKHSGGGYPYPHSEGYPPSTHSGGGYPYPHSDGYPPSTHSGRGYPRPEYHGITPSQGVYPPPEYHGTPASQGGYHPPPPPQYGGYGHQQSFAYREYPPPPPPRYGYSPSQPDHTRNIHLRRTMTFD